MIVSRADYRDLKAHYDKAVKDGKEVFTWRGQKLLVGYAKYLIEYLGQNIK